MENLKNLYKRSPAVFSVILCVALILTSAAVYSLFGLLPIHYRSFDLTKQRIFTLSDTTKDTLKGLSETVDVILVSDSDVPDSGTVDKLLKRYESYTDKLNVTVKGAKELQQYGTLTEGSLIVKSGKRETVVYSSDYFDLSLEYFNLSYNNYYYFLQNGYELGAFYDFMYTGYGEKLGFFDIAKYESVITNAIDFVAAEDITTLYSVMDHGETVLDVYLYPEMRENYIELTYGKLADGIPENADGVLINDPTSDLSDADVERLSAFLQKGGKLTVITSYANINNLGKLLSVCEKYGLTTDKGFVCEDDTAFNVNGAPHIIMPIPQNEALEGRLPSLNAKPIFSGGTGIEMTEKEGIRFKDLLTTSDNAYSKQDAANSETSSFQPDKDKRGKYSLGVIAEDSSNNSSVLWFSSFAFTDSVYDTVSSQSNFPVFLAALGAQYSSKLPNGIPSVSIITEPLNAPAAAFPVGMLIAILLPCLLVMAGAAAIFLRRRKYYAMATEEENSAENTAENMETSAPISEE